MNDDPKRKPTFKVIQGGLPDGTLAPPPTGAERILLITRGCKIIRPQTTSTLQSRDDDSEGFDE